MLSQTTYMEQDSGNNHLALGKTTQPAITCSKLTIETVQRHWRRSGVFIVNFEHISHLVLLFLLLTLNI